MSIQINSSQQLFQHIDNGDHFQLNGQTVEKQGFFSHMMQSIGDAFRSLSAAGRAAIAERNNALLDAMARLVAQDGQQAPVNPAAELLPPAVTPQQRTDMAVRLAAGKALSGMTLPAGSHDIILQQSSLVLQRRLKYYALQQDALNSTAKTVCASFAAAHAAMADFEVPEQARETMPLLVGTALHQMQENGTLKASGLKAGAAKLYNAMMKRDTFKAALSYNYMLNTEEAFARHPELSDALRSNVTKGTGFRPTGVHEAYCRDANRSGIRSINGESALPKDIPDLPANAEDRSVLYENQLLNATQGLDQRYVRLISTLAAQQGLARMASMEFMVKGNGMPPLPELTDQGMSSGLEGTTVDITVNDHEAVVHLDINGYLKGHKLAGTGLDSDGYMPRLSNGTFTLEARINLDQELGDKLCPDFTVTEFSCRPAPLQD